MKSSRLQFYLQIFIIVITSLSRTCSELIISSWHFKGKYSFQKMDDYLTYLIKAWFRITLFLPVF